ncbi:mitochondrial large subunit ribosomal protein-domain-containing protein [Aspergillus cavernicola]|uniref:Large ribosomal subunit protein mL49 n=1 Tax=Aspergillus cavernicola TaxID=176166 RepID=A0ABR4IPL3_9EURO
MASLFQSLPVSAVRKQSTTMSGYLYRAAQPIASSGIRSSVSSRCFQSRLISSQTSSQSHRATSHVPVSSQQRRTFLVQLKRQSQTLKENTSSTVTPPPSAANLQLTNLPYFIRRTPSNQLPVYLITKAGGTKQQTKIQKTEGDMDALRSDLARYLGLESGDARAVKSSDITINRLNGHIIVKGWRKPEIQKFLLERNF